MNKHGLDVDPFLEAENPPIYGFSNGSYPIFDPDCRGWGYRIVWSHPSSLCTWTVANGKI
eukprot:scaffold6655_cov169-Amphora_coffeaeformis.AAC.32